MSSSIMEFTVIPADFGGPYIGNVLALFLDISAIVYAARAELDKRDFWETRRIVSWALAW